MPKEPRDPLARLTPAQQKRARAMLTRLAKASKANAKARAKAHYTDDATVTLIIAVACAPVMPTLPNAETMRRWCALSGAPSVQRNEVTRKATNYRADNAIRARLASLIASDIIPSDTSVVWAVNNAEAMLAPFSEASEKVYIVRY